MIRAVNSLPRNPPDYPPRNVADLLRAAFSRCRIVFVGLVAGKGAFR